MITFGAIWTICAVPALGTLVAAADPHPALCQKIENEYHCSQIFNDYETMLTQVALDAVYIFSDNAAAADITEMAAARGLHVMVEKPMTSTLAKAKRMVAACRQAGVQLMVNWPFAWNPGFQKALDMAAAGEIGHLHGVKYRSAHAGPKELGCTPYFYNWLYNRDLNGAGALMDYACYGAALARHLLGQPSRVTGVAGHFEKDYITLEDNAVVIMEWARAMAISEASWTQIGHLTSYVTVIYGSEGTLMVEPGKAGRVLLATRQHEDGIEIDYADQRGPTNATEFFLSHLRSGQLITGLCSAEVGRDAQEILEAALISAARHSAVSLPLAVV